MDFILASTSPNRAELLRRMGISFSIEAPDFEEIIPPGKTTTEIVQDFALGKALSVYQRLKKKGKSGNFLILGCDSMIDFEGKSVGKADSRERAFRDLWSFRGKRQGVVTGISLIGEIDGQYKALTKFERSEVLFRDDTTSDDLERYLDFGDWEGKCGSYSILGTGIFLLESIEGDFQNIIGIPILLMGEMMREMTGESPWKVLKLRV